MKSQPLFGIDSCCWSGRCAQANRSWGLPAYDGGLFAPDGLPGAPLLERLSLPDAAFGPVLAELGFDSEAEDPEAGIDYGGLEISHLGRIYEGLLALKLSLATTASYLTQEPSGMLQPVAVSPLCQQESFSIRLRLEPEGGRRLLHAPGAGSPL